MKPHIICFGDSNTHGYCADPNDCASGELLRFNEQERWPRLLEQELGGAYLVMEEGLSGRTTVFDDPLHEGLNALSYIHPCLKSHEPVHLLAIMLGTNDTKERFGASAACIALGMERLIKKALVTDCWLGGVQRVLLIAPPPIGEGMEHSAVTPTMGQHCVEKSRQLAPLYAECAARLGVEFLDAAACEFNAIDYMHLTRRGHATLAKLVAKHIAAHEPAHAFTLPTAPYA